MASPPVFIFKDAGLQGDLVLGGSAWGRATGPRWVRSDILVPQNVNVSSFINFSFNGIAFALWGNLGPSDPPVQIYIDDRPSVTRQLARNPTQRWTELFRSDVVNDGRHSVNITDIFGQALDYILVTPGSKTQLLGETLIVDDSQFGYEGNGWISLSDQSFTSPGPVPYQMVPYNAGVHQTRIIGDVFKFAFAGTRFQVFGILNGNISITYTIDNQPPQTKQLSNDFTSPNFLLFDSDGLSAGPHTVRVALDKVGDFPLTVDYVLYDPSFPSLETMPDLSSLTAGTTTLAKSSVTSSTSTSTSTSTPSESSSNTRKSSTPTGAIAGGVIGSLAAIALVVILYLLLRRRRQKERFRHSEGTSFYPGAQSPYRDQDLEPHIRRPALPTMTSNASLASGPTVATISSATVLTPHRRGASLGTTVPTQTSETVSRSTGGSDQVTPLVLHPTVSPATVNVPARKLQTDLPSKRKVPPSDVPVSPGLTETLTTVGRTRTTQIDELRREIAELKSEIRVPPPYQ